MAKEKKAFIVTPIGRANTSVNRAARGLIETVLTPVLISMDFTVNNPMNDNSSGSITNQIIGHIVEDDLVIVNLTDMNPNVMYELALRHSTDKPVVILIRSDQMSNVPFDIKDERIISFNDSLYGVEKLKKTIKEYINEAMNKKSHSPVYNATQKVSIVRGKDSEENIVPFIESLKGSIDDLQSQVRSISNENLRSNIITSDLVSDKITRLDQALNLGQVAGNEHAAINSDAKKDDDTEV